MNERSSLCETHRITIDEHVIDYTLKRSARKSLGFTVNEQGLVIRAPAALPFNTIETTLLRHQGWVLDRLRLSRPPPPIDLSNGAQIPYLGSMLHLHISRTRTAVCNRAQWHNGELHLSLTQHADTGSVLTRVLKNRARHIYTPRLAHYCQCLRAITPPLRISSARTRWGSASPRCINLNWRLIHFSMEIVDHVIAHEAAHLREANHGQRFYQLLASLDPNHQIHSAQLRSLGRQLPSWTQSKERL